MKKYMVNEQGRSMIEMLGVLAIVGVLSVSGIAGYSKAMGKFKISKAMDQVSTISSNIKTMFASSGTYNDLIDTASTSSAVVYELGLFPEEMVKSCSGSSAVKDAGGTGNTATCVQNGLNGKAWITTVTTATASSFKLNFDGLSKEACTAIAGSDWGGASGFKGLTVSNGTASATVLPTDTAESIFTKTETGCACTGTNCTAVWEFF